MTTGGSKRILLGHISSAHGIRGEVLVKSHAADPADIAAYGPLSDAEGRRSFKLKVVRVTPKGVIARIAGVADRNAAEALRGTELYVERSAMGEAAEGEYFYSDLIGLAAVNTAQETLGRVVAIHNFGAGDIIEIAPEKGATMLLPFTNAVVPTVDIKDGRVVIELPQEIEGEEPTLT